MSPVPAPRATGASPFSGKTLGRCRIGRPIGRGATATVFHASYLPLKRDVAVKILRADASTPEARARFVDEAKSLAKLDHENVVRVFDVVEDGGYILIIMDFVEGRSVLDVIEEDGPLDPASALETGRQIALALDHCHANRVLHRDVKPGNVILREDGKAVLVDFGNAEIAGAAANRKGTAHYVAPEVFQGKKQDEKSDTYSLGATLFHMLAGEPPYRGQSVEEILAAHEAGKLRAPSHVNPEGDIPRELDVLVKRAMAPTRGYRFAARDLAAELAGLAPLVTKGPSRVRSRRRGPRGPVASSSAQKHTALYLGLGLVGVIAAGIAFAVASGSKPPPAPPPPPKTEEPKKEDEPLKTLDPDPSRHDLDPGFDKRAGSRAARDEAADKALRDAIEYASRNPDKPGDVAAKLAAVASEYAELSQGRLAKDEAKVWQERALSGGEKESREAAKKAEREREQKALEEGLKKVSDALASFKFPEALAAFQDVEAPAAKIREWKHRGERLNALIGFPEMLNEALKDSPVSAVDVRGTLAKGVEKVVGVSADGLLLKSSTGGERTVPWGEVRPVDVTVLGRKVLRNTPEPRIMLAAWCWETGQIDEAKKEIDTALLTDRTGTASTRVEELFGGEDER
jgi:serine/threonine protein kinase